MSQDSAPIGQGSSDQEGELTLRARGQLEQVREPLTSSRISLTSEVSTPEAARPGVPADSFPGYEILHEIHCGGQGVVYQAIQKATKRKVAIKVMKEGPFAGKRDEARFMREVEILGQLNHPPGVLPPVTLVPSLAAAVNPTVLPSAAAVAKSAFCDGSPGRPP
jgi:serine/threonine protein kinase